MRAGNGENSKGVHREMESERSRKQTSDLTGGVLDVSFPHSAVLYLRHNKNTPDVLTVCIHTPGGSVSYDVPALKVKRYSIDEIFRKRLLFLIPFYIFTYEDQFREIEEDRDKLKYLRETYSRIAQKLEELCLAEELDEYTKQTICEMSEKVLANIAEKYENIKKEVGKVMGGQVLEYEAKNILRQGIEQGIEQGIADSARRMLTKGYSCEHVSDVLELAIEEVRKIQKDVL